MGSATLAGQRCPGVTSRDERERIKRAMGIGQSSGYDMTKHVSWTVHTWPAPEVVDIMGVKCIAAFRDWRYFITSATFPTLNVAGDTLPEVREAAAEALWTLLASTC